MKKTIILLMLVLSFLAVSCGGDDYGSCVKEYEERIVPCTTDSAKEQRQFCRQGRWINQGFCYLCEEYNTRTITCATDETRDQIQICSWGDWIDRGDCLCLKSNKFCHSHDGLSWSDASSARMTWNEAITYCEDLGGRVPTISELRTLIQNCPVTETGGDCEVTDSCLSWDDCRNNPCLGCEYDDSGKYSVFGYINDFRSSSEVSGDTDTAWRVSFLHGGVGSHYKSNYFYVLCVK